MKKLRRALMDEQFKPINSEELSKINIKKLKSFFEGSSTPKKPKTETLDYLLNSLSIEKELIENEDIYIRNYLFATLTARNYLIEIEARIKEIKEHISQFKNRECYPCRKLIFFQKKNERAKDEIVNFLCFGLEKYLSKNNDPYSDLINRNDVEKMWMFGPTYDYNYNAQYYDPNYDFSTYAKFVNTPNTSVLDSYRKIKNAIVLKKEDEEKYYNVVIDTVESNNLLENMAERIAMNYHFHKRKEIFDTMTALFKEEKYITFIITAAIQIEGMFYELVTIRYGGKENQGTLSEKADKTFSNNPQNKHALYPYFAFDIPELRNKVAHIGLVEEENIKHKAYELVLDLHCILSLAEKESLNKFINVVTIFNKINEDVKPEDYDSDDKYKSAIAEHLFSELYLGYITIDECFWKLLLRPTDYKEELNYYLPDQEDDNYIYIKDMVLYFHSILRHELFWQVVFEYTKKLTEINFNKINDMGKFIYKLKNMFIPILTGNAKSLCIEVNKELQKKKIIK